MDGIGLHRSTIPHSQSGGDAGCPHHAASLGLLCRLQRIEPGGGPDSSSEPSADGFCDCIRAYDSPAIILITAPNDPRASRLSFGFLLKSGPGAKNSWTPRSSCAIDSTRCFGDYHDRTRLYRPAVVDAGVVTPSDSHVICQVYT